MTYFPEKGDPAEYDLVASRSVAVRENVPKTLEQIVAETDSDPNPFPPFNMDMALLILFPFFAVFVLISGFRLIRKRKKGKTLRSPRPVGRYPK